MCRGDNPKPVADGSETRAPLGFIKAVFHLAGLGNASRHHLWKRNKTMTDWSLSRLLALLHDDVQLKLGTVRRGMGHPGAMGDASENVWLE